MKSKIKNNKENKPFNFDSTKYTIPEVDYEEIIPRIKIYDCSNDNSYWFRKIGFNCRINED
jgi:hypothetical protein